MELADSDEAGHALRQEAGHRLREAVSLGHLETALEALAVSGHRHHVRFVLQVGLSARAERFIS